MPKRLIAKFNSGKPLRLSGSVLPQLLISVAAFSGAAVLAGLAAWASSLAIESRTSEAVRSKMIDANISWVTVSADGLQLLLSGTAPNEAARFRAVNLAGSVIDSSRVRDLLDVTPVKAIAAPDFSVEILRNDDGIQLIGLLPAGTDPKDFVAEAESLDEGTGVSDMLETANYPAPEGWDQAFAFGVEAMRKLPRSKISVSSKKVEIKAIADSAEQQRRLESELARARPEKVTASIDISAPRPVLTPFTLRFVKDDQGARFDACSADTDRTRDKILSAGVAAGVTGKASCTVGLGVPSPSWADAVGKGIAAVDTLGAGTITFSDADVSLVAANSVAQADFDRVVGELQAGLPEVFSLNATLERKADASVGPAEFTARLGREGTVELRGRLTDERLRDAVDSFAQAQFGVGRVKTLTRLDAELPDGWPVRVLAGLEALGELAEGQLLVRADRVEVQGITGSQTARDRISQILSDKLGQGQTFRVSVTYDESLDPLAALPTPEECAEQVHTILGKRKITFPPGSAEIDGATAGIMDALAETLAECGGIRMEIAGHTDSQGSEGGNQALSQARAEAVLLALQGRGVDVSGLSAIGYGESVPIADNQTEEGREANRRIEFTLMEQPQAAQQTAQATAATEPADSPANEAEQDKADAAGNDAAPEAKPDEPTAPAAEPTPEPAPDATPEAAPEAANIDETDDGPSLAPTEKTLRPLARPARGG